MGHPTSGVGRTNWVPPRGCHVVLTSVCYKCNGGTVGLQGSPRQTRTSSMAFNCSSGFLKKSEAKLCDCISGPRGTNRYSIQLGHHKKQPCKNARKGGAICCSPTSQPPTRTVSKNHQSIARNDCTALEKCPQQHRKNPHFNPSRPDQ